MIPCQTTSTHDKDAFLSGVSAFLYLLGLWSPPELKRHDRPPSSCEGSQLFGTLTQTDLDHVQILTTHGHPLNVCRFEVDHTRPSCR